jgi:hypothetical protein
VGRDTSGGCGNRMADLACGCVSRPGKRAKLPCPPAPIAKGRVPSIALRGRVSEGALASNSGSTRSAQSAAQSATRRRSSSLRVTSFTRAFCRFLCSLSLPTTPPTPFSPAVSRLSAATRSVASAASSTPGASRRSADREQAHVEACTCPCGGRLAHGHEHGGHHPRSGKRRRPGGAGGRHPAGSHPGPRPGAEPGPGSRPQPGPQPGPDTRPQPGASPRPGLDAPRSAKWGTTVRISADLRGCIRPNAAEGFFYDPHRNDTQLPNRIDTGQGGTADDADQGGLDPTRLLLPAGLLLIVVGAGLGLRHSVRSRR